ncbi:MAG TPA: hypothetical protein VFT43_04785 [Candidatus Polarisedimenticolia bacterium]|nr:hypothetical protein [Candidatus Polarisedimenticolia bacterium]
MKITRRSMARLIVGAPVAAAAAAVLPAGALLGARPAAAGEEPATGEATPEGAATHEPEETPLGRFLAKQEEGLTSEERKAVRRQVAGLEESLREIREHSLGNEVPPSDIVRALRSERPRR